jgi:hypothetical protein
MRQVDQHLQALADNLVAGNAANVCDQPHSAGVVLIPRVIEPLRLWCAGTMIRSLHGNLLDENFPCEVQFRLKDTASDRFLSKKIASSFIDRPGGAGPAASGA